MNWELVGSDWCSVIDPMHDCGAKISKEVFVEIRGCRRQLITKIQEPHGLLRIVVQED